MFQFIRNLFRKETPMTETTPTPFPTSEETAQTKKAAFLLPFTSRHGVFNLLGRAGHAPPFDELMAGVGDKITGDEDRPEQRGEELEHVRQFLETFQEGKGPVTPPPEEAQGIVRDFTEAAMRDAGQGQEELPVEDPGPRPEYKLLAGSVFHLGGFPCEYTGDGKFRSKTPIETIMEAPSVDAWVKEPGWTGKVHKPSSR